EQTKETTPKTTESPSWLPFFSAILQTSLVLTIELGIVFSLLYLYHVPPFNSNSIQSNAFQLTFEYTPLSNSTSPESLKLDIVSNLAIIFNTSTTELLPYIYTNNTNSTV